MPVRSALLAEVGAPRPAHDHGLDRVAARRDAELAVAVERDRADVALGQPVGADQLVARRPSARRPSTGSPCRAAAPSCAGAACARRAGRPRAPSACRSSGCPRRRPSRSAGRARRRGPSRRPSRRARRSSRSSRSPAPRAPFGRRIGEVYQRAARSTDARPDEPLQLGRRERRHVRVGDPAPIQTRRGRRSDRSIRISRRPRAAGTARRRPARSRSRATTSSGRATRTSLAPTAPRDRRLVGPAVARHEREHVGAVADEHERLDDLRRARSRPPRRRRARSGVPSANSSIRASTAAARRTAETRSTGLGPCAHRAVA